MLWLKIIGNVVTLFIPALIRAAAKARRKKREQKARLAREKRDREARKFAIKVPNGSKLK